MDNLSVKSYKSSISFGSISREAKFAINRGEVRTILEKEFGIGKKQLKQMDASSVRVKLLASVFKDRGLSETFGLLVNAPLHPSIPAKAVFSNAPKSGEIDSPWNLASFVKKAYDMVMAYQSASKEFVEHPVMREWSIKAKRARQRVNNKLNEFKQVYNDSNESFPTAQLKNIEKYSIQEEKINIKYFCKSAIIEQRFASAVNNDWDDIIYAKAIRVKKTSSPQSANNYKQIAAV